MIDKNEAAKSGAIFPCWVDKPEKPSRFKRALACIFPERCYSCGEVVFCGEQFCEACLPDMQPVLPPVCLVCGNSEALCECYTQTKAGNASDRTIFGYLAPFYYKGAAKNAIHRFKFKDKRYIADFFAASMAKMLKALLPYTVFDYVTFVPISRKALAIRGYNQGELLAREVSKKLGVPYIASLAKIRDNLPQRDLPAHKREGNVSGAYELLKTIPDIAHKTILIIDDVITTGSTLRECGRILAQGKPYRIYALAATRTLKNDWKEGD